MFYYSMLFSGFRHQSGSLNSLVKAKFRNIAHESSLVVVVVVALLIYVHGKHLRSCRDGQLT